MTDWHGPGSIPIMGVNVALAAGTARSSIDPLKSDYPIVKVLASCPASLS